MSILETFTNLLTPVQKRSTLPYNRPLPESITADTVPYERPEVDHDAAKFSINKPEPFDATMPLFSLYGDVDVRQRRELAGSQSPTEFDKKVDSILLPQKLSGFFKLYYRFLIAELEATETFREFDNFKQCLVGIDAPLLTYLEAQFPFLNGEATEFIAVDDPLVTKPIKENIDSMIVATQTAAAHTINEPSTNLNQELTKSSPAVKSETRSPLRLLRKLFT